MTKDLSAGKDLVEMTTGDLIMVVPNFSDMVSGYSIVDTTDLAGPRSITISAYELTKPHVSNKRWFCCQVVAEYVVALSPELLFSSHFAVMLAWLTASQQHRRASGRPVLCQQARA